MNRLAQTRAGRYAIALLSVALVIFLRAEFEALLGGQFFIPPMFIMLAFVSWYCGLGPGAVALVVGMVAYEYYVVAPRQAVGVHGFTTAVRMALTSTAGAVMVVMGHVTRRAQEGLRRSGERLQLAQQAAKIGTFDWDLVTGEILWTEELEALYGLPPGGFGGKFESWANLVHPDDRERLLADLRAAVESRRDFNFEFRIVQPSGAVRWLADWARVICDQRQQPVRVIGVNVDVTDRKQADADREAAGRRVASLHNELARMARVQALGEMASGLAHEINQPLAAILLRAEVSGRKLRQAPPDNPQELLQALDFIGNEAHRAGLIIRRMKDFVRRTDPPRSPLNLAATLNEIMPLVDNDLRSAGVAVRLDAEPGLPEIVGDKIQIQQVLLNLVRNALEALEATPPGRRSLCIALRRAENQVEAALSDSGCGISPEFLSKLFLPFHTTKPDGMGMGLALCRTIIDAHGGRIWAEANPSGGTTFFLRLPVRE